MPNHFDPFETIKQNENNIKRAFFFVFALTVLLIAIFGFFAIYYADDEIRPYDNAGKYIHQN